MLGWEIRFIIIMYRYSQEQISKNYELMVRDNDNIEDKEGFQNELSQTLQFE